jgi:hypothetical protein
MATVQIGGPVCFRNQLFARAPATRRSRSVDDALVRLASRLFGLSAHGTGIALFRHGWNKRQADFGAAALTRSRGAQSDQQRTRQHEQQLWSTLRFFVSTQGARDSLGEHWSSAVASLSHQPLVRGEKLRARARAERARGKHKANA